MERGSTSRGARDYAGCIWCGRPSLIASRDERELLDLESP
jgi:hypothetical protein